ncbi:MAG TPA: preprotein translocase subunit SecE [Acidimicrobiia bacterium]|jgi:preprotein translocase subunit SecE|nr:preprotein translocase subunit SecE [Acidimicrobiia bacterium]
MTNRQIRRLQEAEERRRKKERDGQSQAQRKAAAMQSRAAEPRERKSFFARVRDYLHEVRVELRKVTWPTRDQMIAFTSVTMITTVVLTAVIFAFDVAAKEFVLWLVELAS